MSQKKLKDFLSLKKVKDFLSLVCEKKPTNSATEQMCFVSKNWKVSYVSEKT